MVKDNGIETDRPVDPTGSIDAELLLYDNATARGNAYLRGIETRPVFPNAEALAGLAAFDEDLPRIGRSAGETIALLDEAGSPATVATNGARYFGFVIGAALPAPAAAERLMLAWDQAAGMSVTSPVAARIEAIASRWLLETLDLPAESAVGFGTSATACGLSCLAAARRKLLARRGWDSDAMGVWGAPRVRVIVSDKVHVTVLKALRILGFGGESLITAPTDKTGRIDPQLLPVLDDLTILCLQAGEVNTGGFDPFEELIPKAHSAGAWVHVDGAFGLWARASPDKRILTRGVETADSWTTDGHKWLNTPYDCAMAICRDADALAGAMNSDAVYASGSKDAQKNLTTEFSRRARGIPVWAALRTLGREGVATLVDRHCAQAKRLARGLAEAGFEIVSEVVINQVMMRGRDDAETVSLQLAVERSGAAWFGSTTWEHRPTLRLSVSSWRTTDEDIDRLVRVLSDLRTENDARLAAPSAP